MYTPQIVGNKLLSIRQALLVLFDNMPEVTLSFCKSATLANKETLGKVSHVEATVVSISVRSRMQSGGYYKNQPKTLV